MECLATLLDLLYISIWEMYNKMQNVEKKVFGKGGPLKNNFESLLTNLLSVTLKTNQSLSQQVGNSVSSPIGARGVTWNMQAAVCQNVELTAKASSEERKCFSAVLPV